MPRDSAQSEKSPPGSAWIRPVTLVRKREKLSGVGTEARAQSYKRVTTCARTCRSHRTMGYLEPMSRADSRARMPVPALDRIKLVRGTRRAHLLAHSLRCSRRIWIVR
jgi:hypothetical protein